MHIHTMNAMVSSTGGVIGSRRSSLVVNMAMKTSAALAAARGR